MKNLVKNLTGFLFLAITLSSCSALKVGFPSQNAGKIDKVAVFSSYVTITKPVLPLINASITNERVNSISTELIPLFSENATAQRDELAKMLKTQLKCDVIYGEVLQKNAAYNEIKDLFNFDSSLSKKDENFPELAISKNDINPFEFRNGKIGNYFTGKGSNGEKPYSMAISTICKKMNVNYIAISNSTLMIFPGDILYRDRICIFDELYLFNKAGQCITTGRNNTKPIPFKAAEVQDYQTELDKYSEILLPIVEKVAAKYGN
jgi:hypothetical protein